MALFLAFLCLITPGYAGGNLGATQAVDQPAPHSGKPIIRN